MLLADAQNLTLSLEAAGAMGAAIGTGIAAAARFLVSYLKSRDTQLLVEMKEGRKERKDFSDAVMTIHGEAMNAVHGVQTALVTLTERMGTNRPIAQKHGA